MAIKTSGYTSYFGILSSSLDNDTEFDVEEGDIIFFPSWLKHQASVNESENVRTIVSWNTGRIAEKTQLYSEYEQYCTHV